MANACVTCVKYLLFAFNFLFWLCGCALLGLGLYLCFEPTMRQYAQTSGDLSEYYIALYCLTGVGGLMMLVGFLGCCGACAESRILLGLFFTFLLLICVVEVGGGFYAYLNREHLKELVEESMKQTIQNVYGSDQVVTDAVDAMQKGLKCCGAESPKDWFSSKYGFIPGSCCVEEGCEVPNALAAFAKLLAGNTDIIIYTEGCSTKLFEQLEQYTVILAGLTIGIGVVQLLGMVFSCCLCIAIGRQDNEKDYI